MMVNAQDLKESVSLKKNELKGNALFLVLGAAEFGYERLLNEDTGLGVAVFFVQNSDTNPLFSLTPYYRAYFGKKPAAGFFVEGFSMLNSGVNYNRSYENQYIMVKDSYSDLALGFGLGSKWIHKKGFLLEINAGIGRNLLSNDSPKLVGRLGISLGYRF